MDVICCLFDISRPCGLPGEEYVCTCVRSWYILDLMCCSAVGESIWKYLYDARFNDYGLDGKEETKGDFFFF